MGRVLYEASFQFDPMWIIPVVMLVIIAYLAKNPDKVRGADTFGDNMQGRFGYQPLLNKRKMITRLCIIAFCAVLVFTIVVVVAQVRTYQKIVGAYKSGEYEIVEGYVENFEPMPDNKRGMESFEINGVDFEYSHREATMGYNTPLNKGGVITGDGQHLKIGYVCDDDEKIIVYIEQLS
ncbi:MAG: hypothetical protein IKU25_05715 [Clostridia bacterium]|nr:hypothetical protein [Clostridia bacterium]